ncbi:DUF5681 domain-containing protein [Shigella flexneri]
MTKRTNKGQFKKGQSGNPSGRPKGSRNKSSLVKAQLTIDNSAEFAAKLFEAIVTRDATKLAEFGLKPDEVNLKSMMEAGKTIMTHSAGEMKAIAADVKGGGEKGGERPQDNKPTFSAVATLKK